MKNKTILQRALAEGNVHRIPGNITYCTIDSCAHRDDCVHAIAYACKAPHLQLGECVFPDVVEPDGTCTFFAPFRVVKVAWGFDNLFADVKAKDAPLLRLEMRRYLGSHAQYYRYKLGQLRLLPEQQEDIKAIFARYGYTDVDFQYFALEVDLTKAAASGRR